MWGLEPGAAELQRYLDTITFLLGLPSPLERLDPAGTRDAIAGTLTDMLRRHAQTRMTVLWVDNLQWADPSLRDQLAVVVRSLSDLPFLLVTGQRPDVDVAWPPPVERPLVLQVPLGPLGPADSTDLVRGILERGDGVEPSDRTIAELVDRGGGNPLFLVELAALAATCGAGSALPGTLRALIAARVDQLPSSQRAIIDNAAVLGSSDSIGSLARFAQAIGQDFHPSRHRRAGRRRPVRRRGAVVAVPQRRRPRGRLPDADQAGAGPAPRRRRRRDGRAGLADRRRRPPRRHRSRAAGRAGPRRRRQAEHHRPRRRRAPRGGDRRRRHRSLRDRLPPRQPGARPAAGRSRGAAQPAARPVVGGPRDAASSPTLSPMPRRSSPGRSPTVTPSRRPRPGAASGPSPRCRGISRPPGSSWGGPSSCCGPSTTPGGWPARCGRGGSPRCSAGRSTTPGRSSPRRWRSTTTSTTSGATPGPTRTWPGCRSSPGTSTTPRSSCSRPRSGSGSSATPTA